MPRTHKVATERHELVSVRNEVYATGTMAGILYGRIMLGACPRCEGMHAGPCHTTPMGRNLTVNKVWDESSKTHYYEEWEY